MKKLLWYHKESDQLIVNSYIDAMFYSLQPLEWNKLKLIGYAKWYHKYRPVNWLVHRLYSLSTRIAVYVNITK